MTAEQEFVVLIYRAIQAARASHGAQFANLQATIEGDRDSSEVVIFDGSHVVVIRSADVEPDEED